MKLNDQSSPRFVVRNVLKFLLLFKTKGLLCKPLYSLLKDSVLSGAKDILNVFERYDLTALSEESNLMHLERLFDVLHEKALSMAREQLDVLYSEANLMESHKISNAMTLTKPLDPAHEGKNDQIKGQESRSFIYGEIEFKSFQKILEIAMTGLNKKTGKFTDLGSGSGKACLWAALTAPFGHILGIEIIEGLHNQALNFLSAFRKINYQYGQTDSMVGVSSSEGSDHTKIELVHGSFLSDVHDWSDSAVAFANSTCFPEDLMMKIAVKSQLMQPGSRFITFTTSLNSPYWRVICKERMHMSWGMATVYVHERLQDSEAIERMMEQPPIEESASKDDDGIWILDIN